MIARTLLLAATALGLAACISYRLDGSEVLNTDAQLRAEGFTTTRGRPVEQAALGPTFRITRETVPTSYGGVALTRAESDPGRPLLVFCGGNLFRQETRGAGTLQELAAFGDVWLFDYPGYGGSPGQAAVAEFAELRTALARRIDAAHATGGRAGDLVFVGHSFGGGVCAGLAGAVRTPSHTVLVGAFRDYASVVRARAGVFRPFVRPDIADDVPDTDIAEALRGYGGQVIAVTAAGDRTVPLSAARELVSDLRAQGGRATLVVLPGAEHVDVFRMPAFKAELRAAFSRVGVGRSPPAR